MTKLIHVSGSDHITQELVSDGPQTFTITGVIEVTLEDKERHAVCLAETGGKTWVPAFTVLKALGQVWSLERDNWVGQKVTLYRDAKVKIGNQTVGGIRVSHVTGITEPRTVNVKGALNRTVTYKFSPLQAEQPREATEPWLAQWQAISNALNTAGHEGDGQALLATAGQVIGAEWSHPNQISPEDAQKILAAVREEPAS